MEEFDKTVGKEKGYEEGKTEAQNEKRKQNERKRECGIGDEKCKEMILERTKGTETGEGNGTEGAREEPRESDKQNERKRKLMEGATTKGEGEETRERGLAKSGGREASVRNGVVTWRLRRGVSCPINR